MFNLSTNFCELFLGVLLLLPEVQSLAQLLTIISLRVAFFLYYWEINVFVSEYESKNDSN